MSQSYQPGRHFLQIPGPTNIPERVLRAMAAPTIDHRGPEFQDISQEVLSGIRAIFKTQHPVVIFPSSGTGAWEAALVNTLSPGDKVVMYETGFFATGWKNVADRLGLEVEFLTSDWRSGVDPDRIEETLKADKEGRIKAVAVVHNETSTGTASDIAAVRRAINTADHPALLMVDTISSLTSLDYRHDEWGVDVTVSASQKGLMLPPGLGFNAVSSKALEAHEQAALPNSYWNWKNMLAANETGYYPYTPGTNLLYGLRESLRMINEEGLENIFARHARHGRATRAAVRAWGLELQCTNPDQYSDSLTAVRLPEGHNSDEFRKVVLDRFNMALGNGLGRIAGIVFRIGHLGDLNDLSLIGTLGGVEMGLKLAGVPYQPGGVQAAMKLLAD